MQRIEREPLFLALTRPAMWFGVPFEGVAINVVVTLMAGAVLANPAHWYTNPVSYWLAGVFVHFAMRTHASHDHNFYRVLRMWWVTKGRALGREEWGGAALVAMSSNPPRSAKDVATSV